MKPRYQLIGRGVYSLAEAQRLTGVATATRAREVAAGSGFMLPLEGKEMRQIYNPNEAS